MAEITKDLLIADLLKLGDPGELTIALRKYGMHCLGCALSHNETIAQAASMHGCDVDKLVEELKAICNK